MTANVRPVALEPADEGVRVTVTERGHDEATFEVMKRGFVVVRPQANASSSSATTTPPSTAMA
ncbi:MAG: hypothetical protein L0H78_22660 [Humibacillus sp.]|nr:hypothetical protein [Humibacillus sp.]